MKRHVLCGLAGALALAGCAHYAAAPPRPEAFQPAFEARRLDKPPGTAWTSAELLTIALAQNPQVVEARATYAAAVRTARASKVGQPLTLTLAAEYANSAPRWGYSAAADVPLDYGVRRQARMTMGDLQAMQAWYDYAEVVWTVRAALAKACVDLRAADVEVTIAERAAELRLQRLQRLQQRVAAGEDDRTIALTAQSELAVVERRVADAKGRKAQAMTALAKALGVSTAAVQNTTLPRHAALPSMDGIAEWRRDAALMRTDVLRALVDYDLAEAALRLEIAKQYPEVRLGPGYTYDHGVTKLPLSVSLVLPPADVNRHAIDQAEAARAAAGRSIEAVQANMLAGVDAALAAVAAAQRAADTAFGHELPTARRVVVDTSRALQAGAADRTEDLGARAAELDAELSVLDTERATQGAVVDLEDSLRRLFDPAEAAVMSAAFAKAGDPS